MGLVLASVARSGLPLLGGGLLGVDWPAFPGRTTNQVKVIPMVLTMLSMALSPVGAEEEEREEEGRLRRVSVSAGIGGGIGSCELGRPKILDLKS